MFDNSEFYKYIAEHNVEAAMHYAESNVPEYLYKYYSLNDNVELNNKKLTNLKENRNWFDLPKNQNDPLDSMMAYVDKSRSDRSAIDTVEYMLKKLRDSFLICSFSEAGIEQLPMWAFYANEHKGFCVKYKVFNKKIVWRILYEENRMPVYTIPLHLIDEMEKSKKLGYETEVLKHYRYMTYLLISTKHISWSAEKEFRIIYTADKDGIGQNVDNKMVGLVATDVYLGYKCSEEHIRLIEPICKEKLKCNCWKACISDTKILDFEKI